MGPTGMHPNPLGPLQLQKNKEQEEQLGEMIQAYEKLCVEKNDLETELGEMVRPGELGWESVTRVVCPPVSVLVVCALLRSCVSVCECPCGLVSGAVCALSVVSDRAVSGGDCVSDPRRTLWLCVYV